MVTPRLKSIFGLILALLLLGASSVTHARPSVAVVLGGGAARGFSHIGLLQAFEDEGIPVDYLVGSSMGSIIAGLYAAGLSTENLQHLVTAVDLTALFGPRLPPRGGLLDASRLELFLDHMTANLHFDETTIPFYPVITALRTGDEVALQEGPISRGMIASMSIPGMFPPVEIGGVHYVDGGLKNAVPANVARDLGADVVVAVDVKKQLDEVDHDNILTNLMLTLYFMIDGYVDIQIEHADVVVVPKVLHDSYMDYTRATYFIEQGYEAALAAMPEIRAAILAHDPDFDFDSSRPPVGLPSAELERRLEAALAAAAQRKVGWRVFLKPGFYPDFRVEGAALYHSSQSPWFGGMELRTDPRPEAAYYGLRAGVGDCDAVCASLSLRNYRSDDSPTMGLQLAYDLGHTVKLSADWQHGASAQWEAAAKAHVGSSPLEFGQIYRVSIGQDPRGLYAGLPTPRAYVAIEPQWRFPLVRTGFSLWEAAQLYPSLLVGGRAHYDIDAQAWGWRTEVGVGLETRLFGLHPMRSRLTFAHEPGNAVWAWSLILAE